jgi:UPF0271 protein
VSVPFGASALRVDLPPGANPRSARECLLRVAGVQEVVVSERHALVTFGPALPPGDLDAALSKETLPAAEQNPGTEHLISVRYDGPDLGRVASLSGLSTEEVIQIHHGRLFEVRVVGFLPGFAYLGDVDPRIAVARLDAPRARVPANSVGLAGARTGIYPCASPGGWNLIGTAVGFTAFDPEHGAKLALGDRVRFVPA